MKVEDLIFIYNLQTKKVSLGRDEVSAAQSQTSAIQPGSSPRLFEQPTPLSWAQSKFTSMVNISNKCDPVLYYFSSM